MSFPFVQKNDTIVATCTPIVRGTTMTSFVDGDVSKFSVFGLTSIPTKATLSIGAMQISCTQCFNIIEDEAELQFFNVPTTLPLYKLLLQELQVTLHFRTEEIAAQAAQESRLVLIKSNSHAMTYSANVSDFDVLNGKYPEDECPVTVPIAPQGFAYFNPSLSLTFKCGYVVPSHSMDFHVGLRETYHVTQDIPSKSFAIPL